MKFIKNVLLPVAFSMALIGTAFFLVSISYLIYTESRYAYLDSITDN